MRTLRHGSSDPDLSSPWQYSLPKRLQADAADPAEAADLAVLQTWLRPLARPITRAAAMTRSAFSAQLEQCKVCRAGGCYKHAEQRITMLSVSHEPH